MIRLTMLATLFCLLATVPAIADGRTNTYPIILVHGFGGWAEGELGPYYYWGGETHLAEELRGKGYDVRVASVSSIGSNWDRACELYAIIKGGAVDYGAAHSGAAGHLPATAEKTFSGLYPEWGERQADGSVNKVHLVGHSMGGQTIRLLTQLLENGAMHEQQYTAMTGSKLSPLFAGTDETKDWVESITTLSTPHDGNPLVYRFAEMSEYVASLVAYFTSRGSIDLMVEQWGISQAPGESPVDHFFRALTMSPLAESWDSSLFDISPYGAAFFNSQVKAQSGIYYFSYATNASRPDGEQYEVPLPGMTKSLEIPARTLGSMTGTINDLTFDETWWPNDGMVPTSSQDGPTMLSADQIVAYNPGHGPRRGVWNHMGTLRATDHYAVLGITENETTNWSGERLVGFYAKLAGMLASLPVH